MFRVLGLSPTAGSLINPPRCPQETVQLLIHLLDYEFVGHCPQPILSLWSSSPLEMIPFVVWVGKLSPNIEPRQAMNSSLIHYQKSQMLNIARLTRSSWSSGGKYTYTHNHNGECKSNTDMYRHTGDELYWRKASQIKYLSGSSRVRERSPPGLQGKGRPF